MRTTPYKLAEIIGGIQEKEIRQVRKMLKSPFFTQRKELQRLFEILIKAKVKKHPAPSLSELKVQLFPRESDDLKLRGAMSDLKKFIEECWCFNRLRADNIQMRLMLSDIYRSRKLQKCYASNKNSLSALLKNQPKRNADYYQQLLAFENEQMKYQSSTKRTDHLFLQEISDTTDVLFLIQKLQNACAQLSHQLVYKTSYNRGLLNYLIDIIETKSYPEIPAIAIYYYCFKFLTENDNSVFFDQFLNTLRQYSGQFTTEDLGAPYRLAINYCIRQSNQGDLNFTKNGWNLYREGLESEILLENNYIPQFTFNNTIALALLLKEYDWTDQFIRDKKEKLEPALRQANLCFNLARLAFARQDYDTALVHLQGSDYKDLINNLISRLLLVKIYFEKGAFEALTSHLDALQQYIRRKEVSDYHRDNFLNTIRFVRKLMTLPVYAKAEREKIRQSILSENILSEKNWLLEKCR